MYTNMNPDSEPWNIALVDNDALVRSYLETYLGGLPEFNICWSMQSGRDAVEAYHHSIACTNCVPDLIVTDLSMHGMSGFELCATIRFENDHTPILGCSSYMIEPYERDAVNNGMQGLLLKNELRSTGRRNAYIVERPAVAQVERHAIRDPAAGTRKTAHARQTCNHEHVTERAGRDGAVLGGTFHAHHC